MIRPMDEHSQIHIPESFIRLYASPERARARALAEQIAQRFEVCDELATSLAPRAQELQFKLGITEADVIDKMLDTLLALTGAQDGTEPPADAVLSVAEARWVVGHLAEQLGWLEHLSAELRALGTDGG